MPASKRSSQTAPDGAGRSYEDYELRMLGGKHVRVKVAEGFTAPGLAHEIGDAGFAAHKARIESMLAKLESLWGVIVVRVRFKRQEPQPPCAYIDIRLPAYTLPAPFAGRPLDN